MILAVLGLLASATATLVLVWRWLSEREIRWGLYAIRDELRFLAISDTTLRDSSLLWGIDRAITRSCADLDEFSLWCSLPALLTMDRRAVESHQAKFEIGLNAPQHAQVKALYERSVSLLVRHFAFKHLFLSLLCLLTVVGGIAAHLGFVWLSRRILGESIRPCCQTERGSSHKVGLRKPLDL